MAAEVPAEGSFEGEQPVVDADVPPAEEQVVCAAVHIKLG